MSAPAVILAAPATGSGKTLLALGIIRALRRRGLKVGCFKVGPDYIDPAFLSQAAGRPCLNLDSWAMRLETLVALLDEAGRDADVVIGEGVMGLFDGAADGAGSTADLAAMFGLPVLLTIDASGMGGSVAALVEGFARFREDVEIDGLVLNRVGSPSHASLLKEACDARTSMPVLGWIGRHQDLALPSRHLGLVQAIEHPDLEGVIEGAASVVARGLDLDRLLRISRHPTVATLGALARPLPPIGQRIAVAKDAAFAFFYESVLAGWQRQGAELATFLAACGRGAGSRRRCRLSPRRLSGAPCGTPRGQSCLHGRARPPRPGEGLRSMASAVATWSSDAPWSTRRARRTAWPGSCRSRPAFTEPQLHLGYRRVAVQDGSPLGRVQAQFRGHEFHYGRETRNDGAPLFAVQDARGRDLGQMGSRSGRVMGSFIHLVDRAP